VDNLTIENLKIDTNRDGIDVDCCRNVRISNCSVNSPRDDAICLKSSFALGYARSTDMVTITNCMVCGNFEEGTLLDGTFKPYSGMGDGGRNGRIKFGTESNGGYKNITISNCVFDGCFGLTIISVDGAVIEDVSISNITMRDVVDSPIFLRLGSRMRGPAGTPIGAIRRLNISNVVCSSKSAKICSIITGVPNHRIEDVKINNFVMQHPGGGTKEDATRQLAENEGKYPEPSMFGTTPAYGFLIRHAHGIEINEVKFVLESADARPCFTIIDADEIDCAGIKPDARGNSVFLLDNVKDFSVTRCKGISDVVVGETSHKEL
jgi:polygalacturonase